jgi:hypothetical protein
MRLPKYTAEQLQEAVQTSTSMRQVLAKLSVAPYGGNYDVLRTKLKKLGLDTSHFLGRAWIELDHVNGNNKDNRLENLRLLCPNCHALTPTYRSKRRSQGLSSGLQSPPCSGGAVSPNLTPFTPAVSEPGAQIT